jgi:hypothetical protein
LGAALLLFLGVIFVLPNLVNDEPEPVADAPTVDVTPEAAESEEPEAPTEDDTGAVPTPSDAAFS